MKAMNKIERALLSLTDKSGIESFARGLAGHGVELLSTGGTAARLRQAGVPVRDVSEFTGFPEMLDGRVKTLHPKVHGGILHQRGNPEHVQQCARHGLLPIDLIAVNLYAFENTVADPDCRLEVAIEQIDIGGPTLLRAAAKNFQDVTVVVDPGDYGRILEEIANTGATTLKTRFELARKVFALTGAYDSAISTWLSRVDVSTSHYFQGE